jgi:hypothetical protein
LAGRPLAEFARVAGLEFEDRAAGLALARDAGLLAARDVVALDREAAGFAREELAAFARVVAREVVAFARVVARGVVALARVVARGRDAVRRAAGGSADLRHRDLVVDDVQGELVDDADEEVGHLLLLATDVARELGRLLVADRPWPAPR